MAPDQPVVQIARRMGRADSRGGGYGELAGYREFWNCHSIILIITMRCVSSNNVDCDNKPITNLGLTSRTAGLTKAADPSVWLYAGAYNGVPPTVWSNSVLVCVEAATPSSVWSAWPVTPTYCEVCDSNQDLQ